MKRFIPQPIIIAIALIILAIITHFGSKVETVTTGTALSDEGWVIKSVLFQTHRGTRNLQFDIDQNSQSFQFFDYYDYDNPGGIVSMPEKSYYEIYGEDSSGKFEGGTLYNYNLVVYWYPPEILPSWFDESFQNINR